MIKRSALTLTLFSFFYVSLSSAAANLQSVNPDIKPKVQQLFSLSGLESLLDTMAPQFIAGMTQSASQASSTVKRTVREVVSQHFQEKLLHRSTLQSLNTNWKEKPGIDALTWLRSDLGKRITDLEVLASSTEGLASLADFNLLNNKDPKYTQRQALTKRLKAAVGGTDFAVDTNMAISLGMAYGTNATSPRGARLSHNQVKQFVEASRAMMYQQLDTYLEAYFQFTYASISDDELRQYVKFMESESGQWYSEVVRSAYVGSLRAMSETLGTQLDDAVDAVSTLVEL